MNLHVVLGNHLFEARYFNPHDQLFMCEDIALCTHYKYHKHKILFFLASMREFAEQIESYTKKPVLYFKLAKQEHFFSKLKQVIKNGQYQKIKCFEIEDKFFEVKLNDFCKNNKIILEIIPSPMFICSRDYFKTYLYSVNKPFMKTFYERVRKDYQILYENNAPVGGKFSFDSENRNKIPVKFIFKSIDYRREKSFFTQHHELISLINDFFSDHVGDCSNFWAQTNRLSALKVLDQFIQERLNFFGDYQDAIDQRDPFLYHATISHYLNIGFITPAEVIERVLATSAPINSKEGFIRQVIGWREFMRGIYQHFDEIQFNRNFFNHQRKFNHNWYNANTGLEVLDDTLTKANKLSYCHHIERLMILSNIMLLSEINPLEVYRYFMELFIDSSDWVMGPNVFGMGQFSDGGIFATKPYIAGSNYIRKMSHYKKEAWMEQLDGLYWRFIDQKRDFLKSNYRLSMMVNLLDKMDKAKKTQLFKNADRFLERNTQ
jgi:deoxyribodipyrimidine photolyase-related protein